MNTALVLSYLGTGYHGWQRQNNGETIQALLERAVAAACGLESPYVSGCGRTDAGVHAAYYVCNFKGAHRIPPDKLPLALNARLPEGVAVRRAETVDEGFDARFACKSKEYSYLIHNGRVRDPLLGGRAYFYPRPLDERRMAEAARHFVGRQDFAAVQSVGTPVRSTVRTVHACTVERRGERLLVRVSADGFLYNMVRAITGTLIYAGVGKLTPAQVRQALHSGERTRTGPTAPACGLYMTALDYGLPALDGRADPPGA